MDSFYAVLYIKPNSLTDEHLTVALLTAGAEGPRLYISDRRLRLLSDVLHRNTFLSLRRHLKAFQQQVDKYRKANKDLLLFDPTYSIQKLEKLSKSTKKSLRYSNPVSVNAWMDEDCHEQLMHQLLGEKPVKVKVVKKSFYHKWRALCNANRYISFRRHELSNKLNKKVQNAIRIDLFSKEKSLIIKGLDFDTSIKNVNDRLQDLLVLCDDFSGYQIMCIYPKPKKKTGREMLEQVKSELSLKIEFTDISTFEKIVF